MLSTRCLRAPEVPFSSKLLVLKRMVLHANLFLIILPLFAALIQTFALPTFCDQSLEDFKVNAKVFLEKTIWKS